MFGRGGGGGGGGKGVVKLIEVKETLKIIDHIENCFTKTPKRSRITSANKF